MHMVGGIDPLQLVSSIREYGNGHQHGGYLAFLEIVASMAISVNTIMHQQCFWYVLNWTKCDCYVGY